MYTFITIMKGVPQQCREVYGEESGRGYITLLDTIINRKLSDSLPLKLT
jgi:hypothetical protein